MLKNVFAGIMGKNPVLMLSFIEDFINFIVRMVYGLYFLFLKAIAWVLDMLTQLFFIFAGMTDIGRTTAGDKDPGIDIVNFFLTQKSFMKAYGYLCLIALGLIVVFAIAKIIKQDYFDRSGPRSKAPIFRNIALSFIAFICVIPIFYFMIDAVGALALLVMKALGYEGGGIGTMLFNISWEDGGESFRTVGIGLMGNETYVDLCKLGGKYVDSSNCGGTGAEGTSYRFVISGLSKSKVWDDDNFGWYSPDTFYAYYWDENALGNRDTPAQFYWYVFIFAGLIMIVNLGQMLLAMVTRLFKLVALFVVAPSPISQIVLDEGQKFKGWKDQVVQEALKVVGCVMSFMIFLLMASFVPEIDLMKFAFTEEAASASLLESGNMTTELSNSVSALYYHGKEPGWVDHSINALGRCMLLVAGVGAIKDIDSTITPFISGGKSSMDMGETGKSLVAAGKAVGTGAMAIARKGVDLAVSGAGAAVSLAGGAVSSLAGGASAGGRSLASIAGADGGPVTTPELPGGGPGTPSETVSSPTDNGGNGGPNAPKEEVDDAAGGPTTTETVDPNAPKEGVDDAAGGPTTTETVDPNAPKEGVDDAAGGPTTTETVDPNAPKEGVDDAVGGPTTTETVDPNAPKEGVDDAAGGPTTETVDPNAPKEEKPETTETKPEASTATAVEPGKGTIHDVKTTHDLTKQHRKGAAIAKGALGVVAGINKFATKSALGIAGHTLKTGASLAGTATKSGFSIAGIAAKTLFSMVGMSGVANAVEGTAKGVVEDITNNKQLKKAGKSVVQAGKDVVQAGKDMKNTVSQAIDDASYHKDDNGNYLTESGEAINKDGYKVNAQGQMVDADDNVINANGERLDKDGNVMTDKDGNVVKGGDPIKLGEPAMTEYGQTRAARQERREARQERRQEKKYKRDADGHFLDQSGHKVDAQGYRINADGSAMTDANGQKIKGDGERQLRTRTKVGAGIVLGLRAPIDFAFGNAGENSALYRHAQWIDKKGRTQKVKSETTISQDTAFNGALDSSSGSQSVYTGYEAVSNANSDADTVVAAANTMVDGANAQMNTAQEMNGLSEQVTGSTNGEMDTRVDLTRARSETVGAAEQRAEQSMAAARGYTGEVGSYAESAQARYGASEDAQRKAAGKLVRNASPEEIKRVNENTAHRVGIRTMSKKLDDEYAGVISRVTEARNGNGEISSEDMNKYKEYLDRSRVLDNAYRFVDGDTSVGSADFDSIRADIERTEGYTGTMSSLGGVGTGLGHTKQHANRIMEANRGNTSHIARMQERARGAEFVAETAGNAEILAAHDAFNDQYANSSAYDRVSYERSNVSAATSRYQEAVRGGDAEQISAARQEVESSAAALREASIDLRGEMSGTSRDVVRRSRENAQNGGVKIGSVRRGTTTTGTSTGGTTRQTRTTTSGGNGSGAPKPAQQTRREVHVQAEGEPVSNPSQTSGTTREASEGGETSQPTSTSYDVVIDVVNPVKQSEALSALAARAGSGDVASQAALCYGVGKTKRIDASADVYKVIDGMKTSPRKGVRDSQYRTEARKEYDSAIEDYNREMEAARTAAARWSGPQDTEVMRAVEESIAKATKAGEKIKVLKVELGIKEDE